MILLSAKKLNTWLLLLSMGTILFIVSFNSSLIPTSTQESIEKPIEVSNTPSPSTYTDFFGEPFTMNTTFANFLIELLDLDGDGDLDIITKNMQNKLIAYRNDGNLSTDLTKYVIESDIDIGKITFGDMDNDGKLDLIMTNSTHILIWYNTGNVWTTNWNLYGESVQKIETISTPYSIKVSDIDLDGDLDIISSIGPHLFIFENTNPSRSSNNWKNEKMIVEEIYPSSITIQNVDTDIFPDIVTSNSSELLIIRNPGNFLDSWSVSHIGTSSDGDFSAIQVCDINNDSFNDVVTGLLFGGNITIWNNDGDPYNGEWSFTSSNSTKNVVELFCLDIDNDGFPNIISLEESKLKAYNFNGTDFQISTILSGVFLAMLGDMDFDGDIDMVSLSNSDPRNMMIVENNSPKLKFASVSPSWGSGPIMYNYSVVIFSKYLFDFKVYVEIDGIKIQMQKINPTETLYQNGVKYYCLYSNLEAGMIHTYKFSAEYLTTRYAGGENSIHYGPIVYLPDFNPYDLDKDGIPDSEDPDRDGDGILNEFDAFPDNPNEWADNDGDGIGDNADLDDDNDGVLDINDLFPFDSTKYKQDDTNNSTKPFYQEAAFLVGIIIAIALIGGLLIQTIMLKKAILGGITNLKVKEIRQVDLEPELKEAKPIKNQPNPIPQQKDTNKQAISKPAPVEKKTDQPEKKATSKPQDAKQENKKQK